MKSGDWKPLVVFAMLWPAFAVGQTQQPAQNTAPDAAAAASAPADARAGQSDQTPAAATEAIFPAVVARVNGSDILGRDLEQRVRAQLASIGNPPWKNLREEYRLELTSNALGSAVAEELVYQKAVATGVKIPPADVQSEFARVAKTFADDAAMNAALASRGLDRTSLMKGLERNLVVAKYINDTVTSKISVTPDEAEEYYKTHTDEFRHPDMVRTSHILLIVDGGATSEQDRLARQRIEALLDRARKGEDFAKLARESSMDSSASQGGDIGYMAQGQLDPAYEAVAFSLPVGTLSDPVRSRVGYHIIKVTDKKPEGLATLDESRAQLMEFLKSRKSDQQLQQVVDQLRKEAKIELLIAVGTSSAGSATASSPRP